MLVFETLKQPCNKKAFTRAKRISSQGYTEFVAAQEGRKESSMPIRAGIFFDMFPFCLLFEKDMIIKNMGGALRNCIPQMVGKKVIPKFSEFFVADFYLICINLHNFATQCLR